MKPVCLHDRDEIAAFLRRDSFLHLYTLGDLDDFFWPYTTWYALKTHDQIEQVVLIYTGTELPVLLALADEPMDAMRELLRSILPVLPRRFYAHLSGDLADLFAAEYRMEPHGEHDKMALIDRSRLAAVDTAEVIALAPADLSTLEELYQASYPGNWFDSRMLETGHYYGLRQNAELVSVAGVHVYSQRYGVAALGNITTRPQRRGSGLGTKVTAQLCKALLRTVDHVGLNVKADNHSAIACYKKLGFERIGSYQEWMIEM